MTVSSSWSSSTSSTTVNASARHGDSEFLISSSGPTAAKSQMIIESVLYPPSHGYGLFITAKRYYLPSFKENWGDPEALTLVFLHATSLHKEIWEPTIESVFRVAEEAQRRRKTGKGLGGKGKDKEEYVPKIYEAWAIDCPNHGESGRWNERILLEPQWYLNCASIRCILRLNVDGTQLLCFLIVGCERYAQAAHHFLSAGPDNGARVDFYKRNLIGIGHSLGGCAMYVKDLSLVCFRF
jgi:hypothetical protein